MIRVESFDLDHNAVKAPYVRLAGTEENGGAKVSKYDLRFLQPNGETLPTGALHSIEHFLAFYMREALDGVIDCSPMGCRTGFYMVIWGEHESRDIAKALHESLEKITQATHVEATTAKECGNYKDHSLFGAQEYAKQVLAAGISMDPFERKVWNC